MSVDGLAHQKWHNQWRTMQEIMGEILKKTWDCCRSNGQYPKEFNLKLKIDYFKDLAFGTIWATAVRKEDFQAYHGLFIADRHRYFAPQLASFNV